MTNFTAAGVLPKSTYNNTDYYYFGIDKKKGEVTTFCGQNDPKKDKTLRDCAIREFMEESLGVIAKKKKIAKVLADPKKSCKIENHKVKQITYIATLKIKGNPMKNFQNALKSKKLKKSQQEITKIVAISKAELVKMIKTKNHFYQGHLFRGDAYGTVALAIQAGKL